MHCLGRTRAVKGNIPAQCNRRESESAADDMLLGMQKGNKRTETLRKCNRAGRRKQGDSQSLKQRSREELGWELNGSPKQSPWSQLCLSSP